MYYQHNVIHTRVIKATLFFFLLHSFRYQLIHLHKTLIAVDTSVFSH